MIKVIDSDLYDIQENFSESSVINSMHESRLQSIDYVMDNRLPRPKLMKRMIKDDFSYQRKKTIFLTVNSISLILSFFNLLSSINIEGNYSLIQEDIDAYEIQTESQSYSFIILLYILVIVHLIKIISCLLGVFAVNQKSERLITFYMILSSFSLIARGIISLLVIISYSYIVEICNYIYNPDKIEGDKVGATKAIQFMVVLVIFLVVEILLSLVCLVQGSQSKEEYTSTINNIYIIKRNIEEIQETYQQLRVLL